MSSLKSILATYRSQSQTEREKGGYFEELIRTYFRTYFRFADPYSDVWPFADWAKAHGFSAKDTGIDLVAKTHGTEEFHAIQCKCYAEDYHVRKADIDSFFTASGQKPFTLRYIVTTTNDWSDGKLIMAYGTGKTSTSLKIAEEVQICPRDLAIAA